MSKEEYKKQCSKCKKKRHEMFARIYPFKINKEWVYLCNSCWNDQANKKEQTK